MIFEFREDGSNLKSVSGMKCECRIANAGGSYNNGSGAGLFASGGNNWNASSTSGNGGARVAFLGL